MQAVPKTEKNEATDDHLRWCCLTKDWSEERNKQESK